MDDVSERYGQQTGQCQLILDMNIDKTVALTGH
jgi:hypothetical protein